MKQAPEYVICISNEGYKTSLVVRRLYAVLPDPESKKRGLLRILDESGEDYLFPRDLFVSIEVPKAVERLLAPAT